MSDLRTPTRGRDPGSPYFPENPATRETGQHVADSLLERYAMQMVTEEEVESLEQHVPTCRECREGLQAEIDYVSAVRGAARKIREEERKGSRGEARA